MKSELEDLRIMVGALLAQRRPTSTMIREQIERVRVIYPAVTNEECKNLAMDFERSHCLIKSGPISH